MCSPWALQSRKAIFQRRNAARFLRYTAVNAMPRAVCKSLARHQPQHGADQEKNNRVVALTSAIYRRTGQGRRATALLSCSATVAALSRPLQQLVQCCAIHTACCPGPPLTRWCQHFQTQAADNILNAARGCLSNPDMPGFRDRCKHNCTRYQKPMAGLLRGFSRRGRA